MKIGIDDGTGSILVERVEKMRGLWRFVAYEGDVVHNEHGRILNPILWEAEYENLITTVGKQAVLDRLFGLSAVIALAGTAVGANSAAAAVGDTYATMTTPAYQVFDSTPVRASLTVSATTTYATGAANINIQEAVLSTASSGTILNRLAPIGPFNKTSAVSLAVTTSITQS